LVAGVHAGVGAAAAQAVDGLAQHLAQAAVYFGLHGEGVGLHLPAVVLRAVVGEVKEIAHEAQKYGSPLGFAGYSSTTRLARVPTPEVRRRV
jgi:hypothetical protein